MHRHTVVRRIFLALHHGGNVMEPRARTEPGKKPTRNLFESAAFAGNFDTWESALKTAGLTDMLKDKGPYTVFAPTDKAFKALPKGKLDMLLKNKQELAELLRHHIVSGKVMSKDVKSGEFKALDGSNVWIQKTASGIKIENANVVDEEIDSSNGVIHAIDKVLEVGR